MDRWSEFEAFSRVAEAGSFRAAASALGVTASAVSKQVASLEERLGVRLLNRTTRRVALTEQGRAFFERLRGVLTDVAEAELEITRLQTELRGRLRIGVPMDFGRLHLAEPLAAFAGRHRDLSLEVEFSDRFVDLIDEGFDVVVRIGQLTESSLIARRIAPCRRVLCASPGYLAEHGVPRTPEDLNGHVRIAYMYEADPTLVFRDGARVGRVEVPARHRTNNGQMERALLLAGQGIALIPTFLVADDLRAGRLQALLHDALQADTAIHAVYPHRKLLSAKVRAVVEFLVGHCGPKPYWDEGLDLDPGAAPGA